MFDDSGNVLPFDIRSDEGLSRLVLAFDATVTQHRDHDAGETSTVAAPDHYATSDADPLADLPLLADDRRFVERQVRYLSQTNKARILVLYRMVWTRAQVREHDVIKKDNAGRRQANIFLRRYIQRLKRTP
ncbi:MAG: hypothetical protein ACYCXX_10145 [Acidiferrobacter thiooxydans]